ncbi:hypothetical protein [Paenibacillus durus]|uniref:Uncharacterized protein n=1 Tax=Paenibacillus durus ATCC 35681 TaxID=1333534 RepID=A0A0F7F7H0_PAEDU|nr:hypothetical protein [Paenibacillus durus]AKG33297.1 hypothetical protein VK70_00615 [Paenibacillus durus ATCC 35681]
MHFKLKDRHGNIISPFINADHKQVIRLNDTEYEIIEPSENADESSLMSSLIADFDADPDIRKMIKESELAIEKGHVFSTKQVIEMIKNREL